MLRFLFYTPYFFAFLVCFLTEFFWCLFLAFRDSIQNRHHRKDWFFKSETPEKESKERAFWICCQLFERATKLLLRLQSVSFSLCLAATDFFFFFFAFVVDSLFFSPLKVLSVSSFLTFIHSYTYLPTNILVFLLKRILVILQRLSWFISDGKLVGFVVVFLFLCCCLDSFICFRFYCLLGGRVWWSIGRWN